MFEINLRDERFRPFEVARAISTWNRSLPPFDYTTISDVTLHIRYIHGAGGERSARPAATKELVAMFDTAGQSSQALLFCLRFPPSGRHS